MQKHAARMLGALICAAALTALTVGAARAQAGAPAAVDAVGAEMTLTTSATRTYSWEISKTVDPPALDLAAGASAGLAYTIALTRDVATSEARIGGKITLINPGGPQATVSGVEVAVQNIGGAAVNCGGFPLTLPADAQVICTFEKDAPNAAMRWVTATVTVDGIAQPIEVTAQASFSPPDVENPIGPKSVLLSDPAGSLTDFAVNGTRTVDYAVTYTCPAEPESYRGGLFEETLKNTATIQPTGQDASASVAVTCTLAEGAPPPATACVRGQGYWKTHSDYGPATPPDDTWDLITPAGEDSPFFGSGLTWHAMMWAPPKKGSAYIILAHKYIPARLNIAAGAPVNPALEAALADAEAFFDAHAPDEKLDKEVRKAALHLAGLLDNFNDGVVGAPACGGSDPDDPSEEEEDAAIGALAADGSRVLFGTVLLPVVEN